MEVNFRDKSQLNSVMNIILHTLLIYILEHNIGLDILLKLPDNQ